MNYFHVSRVPLDEGTLLKARYGNIILNRKFYRLSHENHNLYMKEMIFEEIRKKHYTSCPSRLNSIYLFSNIENARLYPLKINSKNEVYIYKVQLEGHGDIGEFDMRWLDEAVWESLENTREIANNYWSKKMTDNLYPEVLFNGKVKVIELTN